MKLVITIILTVLMLAMYIAGWIIVPVRIIWEMSGEDADDIREYLKSRLTNDTKKFFN